MRKSTQQHVQVQNPVISIPQKLEPILEQEQKRPIIASNHDTFEQNSNTPNVHFSKFNDSFQKRKNQDISKNSFEISQRELQHDLSTSFSFGNHSIF